MERDFIIVVGNQGFGKSVWTKLYSKPKTRLLVFDPKREYPANFSSPPDEWVPEILAGQLAEFKLGTSLPWELPMLADTAYAAGNVTLVIEECALIFKRGEDLQDWARPLIFMGREQQVHLVLVAQRAAKIPLDIRSQASRIVTFRQTEPADVKALQDRVGEIADAIPTLAKLECLDWEDGSTRTYSVTPA